ncbi:hypothetical protein Sa4125_04780 [Aureimonas sp. SA4125]|nr:hypothetical protein Sa4125_04780 [Aureimonas sp. SA4125]
MTAFGESGKIERPLVHMVHKGRLDVDDAARTQDPPDFGYHTPWLEYVLEFRLNDQGIFKRDVVSVGDQPGIGGIVDDERDNPRARMGIQCLGSLPSRCRRHDQNDGPPPHRPPQDDSVEN